MVVVCGFLVVAACGFLVVCCTAVPLDGLYDESESLSGVIIGCGCIADTAVVTSMTVEF